MNDNIQKEVITLPPFKRFCMTIGELPSSYVETMTYYEMVLWFTKYLGDTIIPTVNNNAEAVTELQNLFVELQSYVNNYFDNLDVQEEINNKLDDMAESGQLTDIIAQYLGLAGMIAFDTVADMKLAKNLVNGSKCTTLGYYSVNDGGGAYYKIRTITNDDVVDEMTIIAVYDDTLIAELIIDDAINVKQLGAYGDGSHDDTLAIQNAINKYSQIEINDGTYILNDIINLKSNINIKGNGILKSKANMVLSQDLGNIFLLENVSNIIIDGITFDGNKSNITSTSQNYHKAIFIVNGENIILNNCTFKNFYHQSVQVASVRIGAADETLPGVTNLTMNNCISDYTLCLLQVTNSISSYINIQNCKALHSGEHGIVFYKNSDNITIENCVVDTTGLGGGVSNTGHGIRLYKNKNVYINNCKISNIHGNGISNVTEDKSTNVYILNNVIDSVGASNAGIYLKCDKSVVKNNKITNISQQAINVIGDYNIIDSNEIVNSNLGILNEGNYNKISSNIINTCTYRGANIQNSSNTSIFNNTFIEITNHDCYIANTCTDSMISLNNGTIVNRGTIKQEDIQ